MGASIKEIQCRSLLTKSSLPEVEYCINPYVGCLHRCAYCYARFMKRFTGHNCDQWGYFLDIKKNAAVVLRNELKKKHIDGTVLIGSVTDAYQPIEARQKVTRQCLEVLAEYNVPISILTKSTLVMRDAELLSSFSSCEVGLTVEFADDQISTLFDPTAPQISKRIKALMSLRASGVKTYAFMGPILPGLSDPKGIIKLVSGKIDFLMAESLNMRCGNRQAILAIMEKHFPELVETYQKGFTRQYWQAVRREVEAICADQNILLKGFYDH